MALRSDRWDETNSNDKLFNFKGQPFSKGLEYQYLATGGLK
jgi:hypothetical protein